MATNSSPKRRPWFAASLTGTAGGRIVRGLQSFAATAVFLLDEQWRRAVAGSTVLVSAGVVHAFRNASDRLARQLVVGPVEIAELGEYPPERWEEVHDRHRSHYTNQDRTLRF